MTKLNPKNLSARQRARDYLSGLSNIYTISDAFIANCEASVEAIFSSFDGDERARLLSLTESLVRDQAEVERCERETLAQLERMKKRARMESEAEQLLAAHQKFARALKSPETLTARRIATPADESEPAS